MCDKIFTSSDIIVWESYFMPFLISLWPQRCQAMFVHTERKSHQNTAEKPCVPIFMCTLINTFTQLCTDIHANTQFYVDFVKEDMKEAWPRLGQRRKEVEHTPGSEQEAARKRGLWQDAHSHIQRIGALWFEHHDTNLCFTRKHVALQSCLSLAFQFLICIRWSVMTSKTNLS